MTEVLPSVLVLGVIAIVVERVGTGAPAEDIPNLLRAVKWITELAAMPR